MRSLRNPDSSKPNAFTLIELLIALTIASVLTAIALPTLKDSMRQNTLSRSASLVKGAFINARSQAIRTGRPYGIVIERRQRRIGEGAASTMSFLGANYSTRMYYVQSPIEYRGDSIDAVAYPVLDSAWAPTNPVAPPEGTPPNSFVAKFFFPLQSAGVLYASANGSAPAQRLIGDGTRFSVGGSDYIFELRLPLCRLGNYDIDGAGPNPAVPGTWVVFNYRKIAPDRTPNAGSYSTSIANLEFPARLIAGQPYPFKFQTNPIRAPLAPVTLLGKTVVDLSVSGTATEPLLFNAQNILDSNPAAQIPPLAADSLMQDVVVMFAPDGRLDGIYSSERDPTVAAPTAIPGFYVVRTDPSTTVCFNVGFVDGILDNIDDGARYPYSVPGTTYQINVDDPALATPPPTAELQPSQVPNYANSECAWIALHPLSGAVSLETVAGQPPITSLNAYYGFAPAANSQSARQVIRARLLQSRRLTTAGTTQ